MIIVVVV